MEPELAVSKEGLVWNKRGESVGGSRLSRHHPYPARETSQQFVLVAVAVINKYVVIRTLCGDQRELKGNVDLTVVLNCRLYQPLAVTGLYIIIFII